MTDDIEMVDPDWAVIPEHCPGCGRDLQEDISEDGLHGWKYTYRDGEATHGEYTEAYCLRCDTVFQRHYEDADVTLKEDPLINPASWVFRAQELEADTVLKRREAQVRALKEENLSHSEIAERLGISESTVGEYSRRINTRIEEAARTLEEVGREVDPLRHLEAQLDGWVATPADRWVCGGCNDDLGPGDDTVVLAEYVGRQWKSMEIFCADCEVKTTGGVFDETEDYSVTYAVVEGTLDTQGEDYVHVEGAWDSKDSLTLRDPEVRKIIN